ncbi:TlyA family rRNA (cytidine-2'-O)-methyltransferase [Methylosinus sp. C49]|uniref:TlyA family RNA methyltransferase n=1 Tax=Methylosinus sp. C49 TaxID=2699395 RepID=UPI0013668DEE|nr:TlyA family RNA methyltransferase [Methylosinus sp. C49]BBU63637.1 TlyA family rRNA (cytidine-2'-O)-methyltransferase [Methylosinus sp. C49]
MVSAQGPLRADVALCERGFFESRAKAQEAILAGLVEIDGRRIAKPSQLIAPGAKIVAQAPHPYVSRGGVKLAHALMAFAVDAQDRYCLDVGASTGGFTDALLRAGARHVVAVDVGHDQLHERLRRDARVASLEGLDARALTREHLAEPPSLIVIDASFISLALVLPPVLPLAAEGASLLALVKPQFEAGRRAGKKGVVRDEAIHAEVCARITTEVEALAWHVLGVIASPIEGGDGNREFLLHARRA